MIKLGDQPELVEHFGEGRGYEHHVVALAAARRELAHDFFVGCLNGDFGLYPGFGREFGKKIFGHVVVEVRDDDFFSRCRLADGRDSRERCNRERD